MAAATDLVRSTSSSDDPDATLAFLHEAYGATLRVGATGGPVRYAVDRVQAGPVTLMDVDVPFDLRYRVVGRDEWIIAAIASGRADCAWAGGIERFGRGDVLIAGGPEDEHDARSIDGRADSVTLPAWLLDDVARTDADAAPVGVAFTSHRPVDGGSGRWRRVLELVESTLTDLEPAPAPLVVGPAARLLAATALATFPNTAMPVAEAQGGRDGHPETLRRAVAFIDANPDLDITLVDVARAAAVTPRAVQLAFRRHLDTTPLAYLRRVRLQHAHEQLTHATAADGLTVGRVAADWGFASPSRFAGHYRAAYGRSPSDTLRT